MREETHVVQLMCGAPRVTVFAAQSSSALRYPGLDPGICFGCGCFLTVTSDPRRSQGLLHV